MLRTILFPQQLAGNPRIMVFPFKIGVVPFNLPELSALWLLVGLEESLYLLQGHLRDLVGLQPATIEELI
ncbi:hypothetical protein [Flagellimonas marina]|uniref:Uncharacterized protein n=1 Tax=Flagellimonas marina TaxID=1775168 RepID=A0ABV8PTK1_9FLAO